MDDLFKFIKDRFSSMPPWVQIATYLTFVLLFSYLLTAPRFLDMRLVSNDYDDEFPIGGAQIEVEISGRVLTLLTDTKGRFSVPISTSHPLGSYLFILTPDPNSGRIKEVQVPVSNSYLSRSKIIYSKKNNHYKIVPNGVLDKSPNTLISFNFIRPVYADDKQVAATPATKEEIATEILKSLEVITKISFNKIPLDVSLRDLELDNIDLSYISDRLNKKYAIDSLPDFLRAAVTVDDLITIANNKYFKNKPLDTVNAMVKNLVAETNGAEIPAQIIKAYKYGKVLRLSKKNDVAIKVLEQVIAQQPKFYFAWFNLALAYEDFGDNPKAEAAFLAAIAIEQEKKLNDAAIYNAYGMYLFKLHKYKEAAVQFDKEKQIKTINSH